MEKKQHGGKRPGAGRHPKEEKAPGRMTFRCPDPEYEEIKQAALEENKSINRYLIDAGVERWRSKCTNLK